MPLDEVSLKMVRVTGKQSIGARDNQEDAFKLVFQDEQDAGSDLLMVMSDGMGGHAGGEIASTAACDAFIDQFVHRSTATGPRSRLKDSLRIANVALKDRIRGEPSLAGMGCTLIGALKMEGRLTWVSVGDSVLFLLRGGKLRRLNEDHSLFGELKQLVKDGKMTQREAETHPRRNALRAAVMGDDIALIDLNAIDLDFGDLVVLATDGLETLNDAEIADILTTEARPDVRALCSDLLNAVEAKRKSNQDNTSVIIYRHAKGDRTSMSTATRWSRLSDTTVTKSVASRKLWLILAGVAALAVAGALAMVSFWGSSLPRPADSMQTPEVTAPEVPRAERSVIDEESLGENKDSIIETAPESDQDAPPIQNAPEPADPPTAPQELPVTPEQPVEVPEDDASLPSQSGHAQLTRRIHPVVLLRGGRVNPHG